MRTTDFVYIYYQAYSLRDLDERQENHADSCEGYSNITSINEHFYEGFGYYLYQLIK